MKVSAIIPTYNRSAWVIAAVESVLAQTYLPSEILVIDDGSCDNTVEALKPYDITLVQQKNAGPSAARNLGSRLAMGDWLAFLDSDDAWCPEKLAEQVQFHKENKSIELSFTDEIWVRKGRRVNACKHHRKEGGWLYPRALELCLISPSSVMLSRSLYERAGGFDEDLWAAEDYDLWLRICAFQAVGYIDKPLIIKNGGHEGQLSSQRGIDRYRVMALEKMMQMKDLSQEYRRLTWENLTERYRILELGYRKHGRMNDADIFAQRRQYWLTVEI